MIANIQNIFYETQTIFAALHWFRNKNLVNNQNKSFNMVQSCIWPLTYKCYVNNWVNINQIVLENKKTHPKSSLFYSFTTFAIISPWNRTWLLWLNVEKLFVPSLVEISHLLVRFFNFKFPMEERQVPSFDILGSSSLHSMNIFQVFFFQVFFNVVSSKWFWK